MKISLVQPDTVWENKTKNLSNLANLILPLYNKTDIVVLPEMFDTGFSINPDKLAEQPGEETFKWMKRTADKGNFGVCGSYIVCENSQYYNRFVFVSPENKVWHYNKRHLFMDGESDLFTRGKDRLIFAFRGMRISPYICYDLRFPVWSRNRSEFDLMIYTANWPESRRGVWNTLLKARAIENQCFVAGVNRIGTDGKGVVYCGESSIIDPYGEIIVSANKWLEDSVTGEISLSDLSEFRTKFPCLKDADDFTIVV
jgi:omega-amidase